ncbi:MAG: GTP 3',8-cyclase MoaA [Thermodesulfobacteriota bacterium]|nr:GTP 3',8-cyclase MoaA [Thermodesulfobacteriota bacterium]
MVTEQFIDKNNRIINYLRLSITDRCNLRCTYCMPEDGIEFKSHSEILTYEEMLRIVGLSVKKGIRKVRLTGGEPLVRRGFIGFLRKLCNLEALEEISLTTNGVLLKEFAADIKECGICRVNISLDSLKAERFHQITGRDYFDRVWEGIEEAERLGFNPIKINVVVIKGANDDEIQDFGLLALKKPYHVRFIEFMPMGKQNSWRTDKFVSQKEIYDKIQSLGHMKPIKSNPYDGPARRFIIEGGKGEIGFIAALSNHFCTICNRLRLTADGYLRSCLFSDQEIDIKSPLRNGEDDDHLLELIRLSIDNKPKDHGHLIHGPRKCLRQMSSIGG